MHPTSRTARLAGLLLLLSGVTGGFGLAYIRFTVIVPGDAAATAAHIAASEFLFRVAIVSNLVSQIALFFFGLTTYRLFRETDRALARVLLASVLMTVGIAVVNALNSFGALVVLSGADYLEAFTADQRSAAAMVFLRLGSSIGQGLLEIFWTPYFFSLGLLVIRSRYLPRILGVLLMMMSVGYAANVLDKFLVPQFYPAAFTEVAMALGALGGIPTILWLLIKGARIEPLRSEDAAPKTGGAPAPG
jgi:hypothetical protein